jgi:hypothetical protein
MEVSRVRSIRIQVKRKVRRRSSLDLLPLDPRDPEVVRAKQLARLEDHRVGNSADATRRAA